MRTEKEIKNKANELWQEYLNDFSDETMPKNKRYLIAINILKWVLKEI